MKSINEIINETSSKDQHGEWCLWEYRIDGYREILIWKGNGNDQSDITEIDEHGVEMLNVPFETVIGYCKKHKDNKIDHFHLDFSNAQWDKIKDIF